MKKCLFRFSVPDVSVHGPLATLLLGLRWGSKSWWECVAEGAARLMAKAREREEKEQAGPGIPSESYPQ